MSYKLYVNDDVSVSPRDKSWVIERSEKDAKSTIEKQGIPDQLECLGGVDKDKLERFIKKQKKDGDSSENKEL